MIYRMLAMNIDGTLLNNGRLTKETKEAIDYVQSKGIYVTLITGRTFPSAKRVAKAMKIENPLVTHQGAYIGTKLDKPLYVNKINEDITYELVKFLEELDGQLRVVQDKMAIMNRVKLSGSLREKVLFNRESSFIYSTHYTDSLSEYLFEDPSAALKIEAKFDSESERNDAIKAIKGMYHEVDCIITGNNRFDIVKRGVSKLRGLLYVCERVGITRDQVVMVGANQDDKDLLDCCGLGIAMGNAPQEVKNAADWITRTEKQNGVAYAVKELFRKQQPIEFLKKMNVIKS
jgi:Cof subfamily protein (haloacid dehalogenase superfamily)